MKSVIPTNTKVESFKTKPSHLASSFLPFLSHQNSTIWGQNLQPLLNAVVTEGGRSDCFTLFFGLHNGEYNDLTTPEELMRLGEGFVERIRKGGQNGSMKLDDIDQEQQEWESWRTSADYLAEAIESLRREGSLQTDLQREQAHHLLSQLASEPVRSSKAIEVLHRLQNE